MKESEGKRKVEGKRIKYEKENKGERMHDIKH
jgi:hypothetical protein